MRIWLARICFVLVLAALGVVGGWIAHLSAASFAQHEQVTLSQVYTDALASGQAYLKVEPDAALKASPDPWNPDMAGHHLGDASYFAGHYYIYFGIVPFVFLLVPWFKVTGAFLSDAAGIWFFCGLGFVAYGSALFRIWRHWFQEVPAWAFALALLTLGVASGAGSLLASQNIYELVSSSAYACFAVAVAALVVLETSGRRRGFWSALGCGAAALTLGCRPNYAPAVAILVGWIVLRLWNQEGTTQARCRQIVGALVPLVLIGVLLAGWNYHRFHRLSEFGFRYQVGNSDRRSHSLLHLDNLPFNLHRYLVGQPRLGRYFPFIQGELPGPFPRPATHVELTDQVYGCLLIYPVILCAGLILAAGRLERLKPLRRISALLGVAALGNLLLLAAIGNGCYRYPIDFLGLVSFLAGIGLLSGFALTRPRLRLLWLLPLLPLLIWSAAGAFCQAISISEHYLAFSTARPGDFQLAARPFNALVYLWEDATGDHPPSVRMTVRLPRDQFDKVEPLLVTGRQGLQDFLFIRYIWPNMIQLGFDSVGHGGPLSGFAPVDYSQPHTFEFEYGSFLPPDDHPWMRKMLPADRALARHMITVLVDGQPVLDGWSPFNPTQSQFYFGDSPFDSAYGAKFTGQILQVERPSLTFPASPLRWQPESYGPLSFDLNLDALPVGDSDPILSVGHRTQGGILALERLPGEQVRFVWSSAVGQRIASAPFTWSGVINRHMRHLEIHLGSLLPPVDSSLWPAAVPAAARQAEKRELKVILDGRTVWQTQVETPDVSPTTVAVARDQLFLIPRVTRTFIGPVGPVQRLAW